MHLSLNPSTCIGLVLLGQSHSSPRGESVANFLAAVRRCLTNETFLQVIAGVLVFSVFVGLMAWAIIMEKKKPKPKDPFERGRFLIDAQKAREIADDLRPKDDPGLPWGGLQLPTTVRTTHFILFGRTGAGKTILLRLPMQSALPDIGLVPDQRALIYDPKLDLVSVLYAMRLVCPIKILCPFDLRSVAWDIAQDCTEPATAIEVANIIVPDEEGHNRYFPDAVRDLLQGVLTSFLTDTPGVWTLRDVIHAMTQPAYLRQIVDRCADTHRLLGYFDNDLNFADVLATINTKLGPWPRSPPAGIGLPSGSRWTSGSGATSSW